MGHMSDMPVMRIHIGDEINGWKVVKQLPTEPFRTRKYDCVHACGHHKEMTDTVLVYAMLICPICG